MSDSENIRAEGNERDSLRELEKSLKESRTRFEMAMMATRDGVWDWDLQTNEVYYSPHWKEMLGYEDSEIDNQFSIWESLVHPDELELVRSKLYSFVEGKHEEFDLEFRMQHKDGRWIDILSRANIFYEEGKARRIVGTHIDITKRKRIRQQLEDSEVRWKFALEGNDDGVWDWNLITNEVFFSKRWKAMLGFLEDEIENSFEEWESRVHPDDLKRTLEDIGNHVEGRVDIYINEHRMKAKNGRYVWILDRGKVVKFREDGKPMRMIGTHTDITQRKNYELELQRLNEEKSKYFSVLAHDLRNLLGSSSQLSELLASDEFDFDKKKVRQLGEMLYKRNGQSLDLLESLLQWGRLSMNESAANKEMYSIVDCAETALQQLSVVAENKSIHIENNIKKDILVMMDINLIITVYRNLLFNAIKYSHENGHIILDAKKHDDCVEVSIKDEGVGMSEDILEKLFSVGIEPAVGTNEEKGTGFGLVVCKEIVKKHGGEIRAQSKVNNGTTIFFTFPLTSFN